MKSLKMGTKKREKKIVKTIPSFKLLLKIKMMNWIGCEGKRKRQKKKKGN